MSAFDSAITGPDVIKGMLNSAEHGIFPAHEINVTCKMQNAKNCLHLNIYGRKCSILGLTEPEKC